MLQDRLLEDFKFQLFNVGNPLFMDDMSLGFGGQMDMDSAAKVTSVSFSVPYTTCAVNEVAYSIFTWHVC